MRCPYCGTKECCGADPMMAMADEIFEALKDLYDADMAPRDAKHGKLWNDAMKNARDVIKYVEERMQWDHVRRPTKEELEGG